MNEELNRMLGGLGEMLWDLIPLLILALLVLAAGYVLARIVRFLVIKFVRYLGNLANQNFKTVNLDQSARFIGAAFFWLIILSACIIVSDILGLSIITNWMDVILKYSPNVLAAILIISVAVVFGNFAREAIASVGKKFDLDHRNTLGRIVQILILLTAIIIAIDQIGIEVGFLINIIDIVLASFLFAAALAFGLGARSSVSNILAAFYVRKMYKTGDWVRIGDIEGRIIRMEATQIIVDADGGQYHIPAKEFNETVSCLIKK